MIHLPFIRQATLQSRTFCKCGAAIMFALFSYCDVSADIVVIQRESFGQVGVFAGSGGAMDSSSNSNSLTSLAGLFSFNDSFSAAITDGHPLANGAANSFGGINIQDNVVQTSSSKLILFGSRSSNGSAQWVNGTGTANSTQQQEFRVRFQVTDVDVNYSLTGMFSPGDANGVHSIRLYRPFTANEFFDIDSAGPLNESGVLLAGRTYEFRLLFNDQFGASAGNPGPNAAASSIDFEFSVSSVAVLGDANGDGALSNGDIAAFVLALTNPVAYLAMFPDADPDVVLDMNNDGVFDNSDIAGFVAALTGGGTK